MEIGKNKLLEEIRDYRKKNPDAHIKITGFSMGAEVAGDVLAELARTGEIPPAQIDGVLYGDPRRPGGIESGGAPSLPGITMRGARDDFGAIPLQEVAIKGDPIADFHGEDPLRAFDGYLNLHPKYFPLLEKTLPKIRNGDILADAP